jgi:arylsulfatase
MNHNVRNVVFITTDQQRSDTIAAHGNPHMITPALDRLAGEGVSFSEAFVCGATCVASRAALYTGMYAHNTGCYSFDRWSHNRTWVHELRDAGWRTAAIGKVHHGPAHDPMAFDDRVYAENFPNMRDWEDDYANYLKSGGHESGCRLLTQDGQWLRKYGSDVFPLPEEYHEDQFIGRMARRWIADYADDAPFYLHIGFQGPHDPFDPPQRFLDLYAGREIPMPRPDSGGFDARPPHYRRHMESILNDAGWDRAPAHGGWAMDLREAGPAEFARMRRHYFALVTQIDEQVGLIMDTLAARGMLDDTLVIFTSDHGDNLGDHGLMYKWLMTDQATRVPFIVRLPDGDRRSGAGGRSGVTDDLLFSQIDVGPTILEAAGLPVPQRLDGRSNLARLLDGDRSQAPKAVLCEDNYLTMYRTPDRKYIHYAGQPYAEYFDLAADPFEEHNLADDPARADEIAALRSRFLDELLVSRYLGSLPQIHEANGERRIWPQNHPEDPWVLHPGMKGNNRVRL